MFVPQTLQHTVAVHDARLAVCATIISVLAHTATETAVQHQHAVGAEASGRHFRIVDFIVSIDTEGGVARSDYRKKKKSSGGDDHFGIGCC